MNDYYQIVMWTLQKEHHYSYPQALEGFLWRMFSSTPDSGSSPSQYRTETSRSVSKEAGGIDLQSKEATVTSVMDSVLGHREVSPTQEPPS